MIPSLRQQFNANFTPEKYQRLLQLMAERCGTPVQFRICETPCFFPKSLLHQMAQCGKELIHQLETPEYRQASSVAIPSEFNVPNETAHPMFIQVDFGLVRDAAGELQPKLVELQGFPSLYAFQPALSQTYKDVYGLGDELTNFCSGLDAASYGELLCRVVLGGHDPEQVVLLEIDPLQQKTLPDFILTSRMCKIETVNIRTLKKRGNKLYYQSAGREIEVRRIYNRAIVDELVRKDVTLPFDFRHDLDVEWAGHPNWYFRMSKFSIPFLKHASVPRTWFLDELEHVPNDRENYVLKPLYSFAGSGILFAPTDADIAAIPKERTHDYILQERIGF